jgi:hypothetical protein
MIAVIVLQVTRRFMNSLRNSDGGNICSRLRVMWRLRGRLEIYWWWHCENSINTRLRKDSRRHIR